jgi:hypothetical protein
MFAPFGIFSPFVSYFLLIEFLVDTAECELCGLSVVSSKSM